jgi:hypothetical protein
MKICPKSFRPKRRLVKWTPGGVVAGEPGLAHAGAVVDDEGRGVFVAHLAGGAAAARVCVEAEMTLGNDSAYPFIPGYLSGGSEEAETLENITLEQGDQGSML